MWTQFYDMSSGGGQKLEWKKIFVEAPKGIAVKYFKQRFRRDPEHVTCRCCGEDFSLDSKPTLEELTGYDRNCEFDMTERRYVERPMGKAQLIPLDIYMQKREYLFVPKSEVQELLRGEHEDETEEEREEREYFNGR